MADYTYPTRRGLTYVVTSQSACTVRATDLQGIQRTLLKTDGGTQHSFVAISDSVFIQTLTGSVSLSPVFSRASLSTSGGGGGVTELQVIDIIGEEVPFKDYIESRTGAAEDGIQVMWADFTGLEIKRLNVIPGLQDETIISYVMNGSNGYPIINLGDVDSETYLRGWGQTVALKDIITPSAWTVTRSTTLTHMTLAIMTADDTIDLSNYDIETSDNKEVIGAIIVQSTHAGSYEIIIPSSWRWADGVAPVMQGAGTRRFRVSAVASSQLSINPLIIIRLEYEALS